MYSLGLYYDNSTGKERYAVFCSRTSTWYFAKRYGKNAAQSFCNRLNKVLNSATIYKED
jgi:hypothetical protein